MSSQQIFDSVARHLLMQARRAVDENGTLFYNGPGELASPMGCIIPNTLYSPEMENMTVHRIMSEFPAVREFIGCQNIELMFQLQMIHDIGAPEEWRSQLLTLASWNGLNTDLI